MSEMLSEMPAVLHVVDNNGNEIAVPREDFWQYEIDALPDAVLIEEFETSTDVTVSD